jgi:hypothetical protein
MFQYPMKVVSHQEEEDQLHHHQEHHPKNFFIQFNRKKLVGAAILGLKCGTYISSLA